MGSLAGKVPVPTAGVCYFDAGQNVMPNLNYYRFVHFIQATTR
jgi:hypothetical protein